MKKSRQKTGNQTRSLRAQDLSSVSGGDIWLNHATARGGKAIVVGGVSPHDDGVISSRN
jgi:hypothetical protein